MSVAFSSSNLVFPSAVLEQLLLFNDKNELYQYLKFYNILVKEENVAFNKKQFDDSKLLVSKLYGILKFKYSELYLEPKVEFLGH